MRTHGKTHTFIPKYLLLVLLLSHFLGCASIPVTPPAKTAISALGMYHRAQRGETLWRIAKMYGMDLDDLVRINNISDAANIEAGQLIFIPRSSHAQKSSYRPSSNDDFVWPLRGTVISTFGQMFNTMINKGINIRSTQGREVVAARDGKVVFYSPNLRGYGRTIIIDHGDGLLTVYARNSEVLVKAGDTVQKGTVIAKVGSAGRDRNEYLHFEIRKGTVPQNPYFYLSR